jgi:hypothetical protein
MRTVNTILPYAQLILYTLIELMPSPYQKLSLQASFALFMEPTNGKMLPEHGVIKSPAALKGSTIAWWGSRRWAIEGFFKTAKYRFGLASFGQQTLLGVYRWLILSFISFVLTHWVYLSSNVSLPPEWRQESELALQQLMPQIAVSSLLVEIERQREFLLSQGLALELVSIKI